MAGVKTVYVCVCEKIDSKGEDALAEQALEKEASMGECWPPPSFSKVDVAKKGLLLGVSGGHDSRGGTRHFFFSEEKVGEN